MRQYQQRVREQQLAAMRAIKPNETSNSHDGGSLQQQQQQLPKPSDKSHDDHAHSNNPSQGGNNLNSFSGGNNSFEQQVQSVTGNPQVNISQLQRMGQAKLGHQGSMPPPESPSVAATPKSGTQQRLPASMNGKGQDQIQVSSMNQTIDYAHGLDH